MANGRFILCSDECPAGGDNFTGHIGDIGIVPQGLAIQANIIAAVRGQVRNNRIAAAVRSDAAIVIDTDAFGIRCFYQANGFT